jgi:hypothetical protein
MLGTTNVHGVPVVPGKAPEESVLQKEANGTPPREKSIGESGGKNCPDALTD